MSIAAGSEWPDTHCIWGHPTSFIYLKVTKRGHSNIIQWQMELYVSRSPQRDLISKHAVVDGKSEWLLPLGIWKFHARSYLGKAEVCLWVYMVWTWTCLNKLHLTLYWRMCRRSPRMPFSKPPISFITWSPWASITWSPCFLSWELSPRISYWDNVKTQEASSPGESQFTPHMFIVRNSETLRKVVEQSIFRILKTNTVL